MSSARRLLKHRMVPTPEGTRSCQLTAVTMEPSSGRGLSMPAASEPLCPGPEGGHQARRVSESEAADAEPSPRPFRRPACGGSQHPHGPYGHSGILSSVSGALAALSDGRGGEAGVDSKTQLRPPARQWGARPRRGPENRRAAEPGRALGHHVPRGEGECHGGPCEVTRNFTFRVKAAPGHRI